MILYRKTIKSFSLRNSCLSKRQEHALYHYLPDYALPEVAWDLKTLFRTSLPILVEIGFGGGDTFIDLVKAYPHYNYIGIEVYKAGIGHLAAMLHEAHITNVRLAPFDAVVAFEHCIPDNTLQGIRIFFPDPWPKRRHHKRRLIQKSFIENCIKKLVQGGFIHIKTDWKDYAHHIAAVLDHFPHLKPGVSPIPTLCQTKFETRGLQLGHEIYEFYFVLKAPQ